MLLSKSQSSIMKDERLVNEDAIEKAFREEGPHYKNVRKCIIS